MGKPMGRLIAVCCAVVLLLPAVWLFAHGRIAAPSVESLARGEYLAQVEADLKEGLPGRETLNELALRLRLFAGQTEQNSIFLLDDELIKNIDPPVEPYVRENTAAVLEFAENVGVPTYFALIPTASAIRQESLTPFARSQVFNQRAFIEELGAQMAGRVTVADVYSALFGARDQYVYYRTEDNLTSLGGFYVYSVLGARLLEGMESRSLADYDIEYVPGGYYGDLYARSPYKSITPDILSLYHYAPVQRQYLVTHSDGREHWTYHALYPESQLELGNSMNLYLGGLSAVTEVHSSYPYDNSLLIFGDKTALAYVPFLANHYAHITVVDLWQLDPADYALLGERDYGQVLFAYGVESFMHTNTPARALRVLDVLY